MAENNSVLKEELLRYLDPDVLARITRLDLRARHVVEGFISGMHRSPFHGFSVEFASHREYSPGDDIRHVDWKVQARTDRLYIKQYEEETNLKATFLLDASESMHFGAERDGGMSKFEYAATAVASLAYMLQQQQDAVGLGIFDEELVDYLPASASPGQLKALVHAMHVRSPRKKTSLEHVAHAMAEKIPRRGLVCLASDLFVDLDGVIKSLDHFRHYDHEVIVLHILDRDELAFPYEGMTRFKGLEEAGICTVEPRALRDAYVREVDAFRQEVRRRCIASRIDYALVSTADNLGAALSVFLAARAAAISKSSAKR